MSCPIIRRDGQPLRCWSVGRHGDRLAAEFGRPKLGYTGLGQIRPHVTDKLAGIELDFRHRALPWNFLGKSIGFRGMRQLNDGHKAGCPLVMLWTALATGI
jgi:hypothetical protein